MSPRVYVNGHKRRIIDTKSQQPSCETAHHGPCCHRVNTAQYQFDGIACERVCVHIRRRIPYVVYSSLPPSSDPLDRPPTASCGLLSFSFLSWSSSVLAPSLHKEPPLPPPLKRSEDDAVFLNMRGGVATSFFSIHGGESGKRRTIIPL